jgi:predicted ATPase
MALSVREFEAEGFRSLRRIAYPMSSLDVFVGANGVGKTNLYRALELLKSAAANTLAHDLIRQGGLASALWAGPRRKGPSRLHLAVGLSAEPIAGRDAGRYRYEVEIGFPPKEASASFPFEPQIKAERIAYVGRSRTTRLIDRKNHSVMARAADGRPAEIDIDLLESETVLGRLEDPSAYPELDAIRRTLLQWRFYHGLRTDEASPIRQPCAAVATPTLASDGSNLAAVFATLAHIRGDVVDLNAAIDHAFPGARLVLPEPESVVRFGMVFPELPDRVFDAQELSDGTLRFLTLAGALLAYRTPPFLALNEPEASLHPDLIEPLARLIVKASAQTQVWLVTHSTRLADAIAASRAGEVRTVRKIDGATVIDGLKAWGRLRRKGKDLPDHNRCVGIPRVTAAPAMRRSNVETVDPTVMATARCKASPARRPSVCMSANLAAVLKWAPSTVRTVKLLATCALNVARALT